MPVPLRTALAAVATAAVLAYAAAGHALPQPGSHEGMAGASTGLCLLLVTVLAAIAAPRPQAPTLRRAAPAVWALPRPAAPPAVNGRARASPVVLERFRN